MTLSQYMEALRRLEEIVDTLNRSLSRTREHERMIEQARNDLMALRTLGGPL